MRKATLVKSGKEYLPNVLQHELEEMCKHERSGKPRDRLQAAIHRKQGMTLEEIGKTMGRQPSTIHRWRYRAECNGLAYRYDNKIPGRPRLLSSEQEAAIEKDLDQIPQKSGSERGSWTANMVTRRILDRFGIKCSSRTALRVTRRLGFSVRKPRPVPYNSATPEERNEFIENIRESV